MSFHTRLDVLDGGVNDALAYILGLKNVVSTVNDAVGELDRLMPAEVLPSWCVRVWAATMSTMSAPRR